MRTSTEATAAATTRRKAAAASATSEGHVFFGWSEKVVEFVTKRYATAGMILTGRIVE
jgi:hypothetical protein